MQPEVSEFPRVCSSLQIIAIILLSTYFLNLYLKSVPGAVATTYIIRLAIPNGAGGVVIGKGGSIIKSINEKSGAKVSMADSSDPFHTSERICSVTCEVNMDALQKLAYAIKLVAAQLMSDKAGAYSNVSTKYSYPGQGFGSSMGAGSHSASSTYARYQAPIQYYQPPGGQTIQYSTDALFNPSSVAGKPNQQTPHYNPHLIQQQAMQYAASAGGSSAGAGAGGGAAVQMQFGVPESLMGAVIGRGGQVVISLLYSSLLFYSFLFVCLLYACIFV